MSAEGDFPCGIPSEKKAAKPCPAGESHDRDLTSIVTTRPLLSYCIGLSAVMAEGTGLDANFRENTSLD